MEPRNRRVSVFVATGLVALTWSGCGSEPAVGPPPMPRAMGSVAHPAPSVEAVLARARQDIAAGRFADAVNVVAQAPEAQRAAAYRELALETAARDPRAAGQFALALPPGAAQDDCLGLATRALLQTDRTAAVDWALAVQPASARLVALETAAAELTRDDPRAGTAWISTLPERPGRTELLRLAAADWAHRAPEDALAWARTLPEPPRNSVTASIAFEMAQTVPERAVAVANTLPDDRDRYLLLSAIAQTWIARDPKAAHAWLGALPSGATRDAALAGFAAATGPIYSRNSRGSIGLYRPPSRLGGSSGAAIGPDVSAGPGLNRDDALRREFERRLQESPVRAADWVATLPAPDVSDEMLRRLTQEWMRYDPRAASNWLELHVPSPARREQILQTIGP